MLIFLGDNGTHSSVTSRFQGTDYRGGKGTTTQRGTHVPLIVSWPSVIKFGRVNRDLVSSVDFLPTICEAASASAPADTDGVSLTSIAELLEPFSAIFPPAGWPQPLIPSCEHGEEPELISVFSIEQTPHLKAREGRVPLVG